MLVDVTDRVNEARAYFDALLDERIAAIAEISGVPIEQFVKINPADFCEKNKYQLIRGYEYIKIRDWIVKNKKDAETFLISPVDAIEETAAQVSYKTGTEITRTLRAGKCQVVPCPVELAQDFFIRNHRQSPPLIRDTAVCFALAYKNELVAVMLYDISNGAYGAEKPTMSWYDSQSAKGPRSTAERASCSRPARTRCGRWALPRFIVTQTPRSTPGPFMRSSASAGTRWTAASRS